MNQADEDSIEQELDDFQRMIDANRKKDATMNRKVPTIDEMNRNNDKSNDRRDQTGPSRVSDSTNEKGGEDSLGTKFSDDTDGFLNVPSNSSSPNNPKRMFLSKPIEAEPEKKEKTETETPLKRIKDKFGFILLPLLTIVQVLLRGLGQVVFCNNAISGIFILVGLFVQDPMLASGSLVAVATNSLTATILGIPKDLIKAGLYGYNGVLVGAALATFLVPKWQITTFAGIIFSSMVATCIHIAMVGFLTPYSLPVLTMPFNLSVVIFLYGCLDSNYFKVEFKGRIPDVTSVNDVYFNVGGTFLAIPRGVGQVYLCDNFIAGLLILFGIIINSRISGFFAIVGSTLGMLYAYAIGVSSNAIISGLWGFNPVLASMAIGGFFFKLNLATSFLAIFAGLTSSMLFAMWRNFFSVWGIPSGTFGFCTGAYIFLFMKDNIPFLNAVPLGDITTPEGNLGLKGWKNVLPLLALLPSTSKLMRQSPPPPA